MEEHKNPPVTTLQTNGNQTEQKPSKKELQQLILKLTEERTGERFTDANFDRENEKIKLLGGAEISIRGLRQYIKGIAQKYEPRFKQQFYDEIYRLNGWNMEEAKEFHKKPEVALYTRQFIYGRFPKEVIEVLETMNPYLRFAKRMHMHHQFLTPDGVVQLKGFIEDAIRVMNESNAWHQFTVNYSQQYGLPFQLSIFDANGVK